MGVLREEEAIDMLLQLDVNNLLAKDFPDSVFVDMIGKMKPSQDKEEGRPLISPDNYLFH